VHPNNRIMIAGNWSVPYYEPSLASGFERLGWEVHPFRVTEYVGSNVPSRIEKKLLLGPQILRLNRELMSAVRRHRPAILLLFKPIYFLPSTIEEIKDAGATILITFNNDNPYEDGDRFTLWRHYHRLIQFCDINCFARPSDLAFASTERVPNPNWIKFWYIHGFHRPLQRIDEQFCNDVVFAGHYEPDGRAETMEYLLQAGVNLQLFGSEWESAGKHNLLTSKEIRILHDEDYVKAIAGAKIGLVFLSHRNRDQYTIRCFEIPACGTMMIAPRTPVLQSLYNEDREAVFFESREELLDKIHFYLAHDDARSRIASAGHRRCVSGKNSNIDRAAEMMDTANQLLRGLALASEQCR
jgi:spore maturation protein CgeB